MVSSNSGIRFSHGNANPYQEGDVLAIGNRRTRRATAAARRGRQASRVAPLMDIDGDGATN